MYKSIFGLGLGLSLSLTLGLTGLSGCAYQQAQEQKTFDENASLYDRLGGRDAIASVVAKMTQHITQNNEINGFFIGANIDRVNYMLTEQICEATGGPCTYTGGDMISVHTGMNITEAQFNALVGDLVKSLNDHRVPQREQQELLKLLGSMKGEIIDI